MGKHARLRSVGNQYVKSEVYKPNCKSVYQLNLQKRICAMQMNLGKRIIITIFINNGNDVVTKRTFLPDFQASNEKIAEG